MSAKGQVIAGSRYVKRSDDWVPMDAPGFYVQDLHADGDGRTMLMRVDPGAHAESHSHLGTEQIYVIAGTFYDDAGEHSVGDYIVRVSGAPHTAGSHAGATLLLIYTGGDM